MHIHMCVCVCIYIYIYIYIYRLPWWFQSVKNPPAMQASWI